jgi:protein tyrosine/serine phosphatase
LRSTARTTDAPERTITLEGTFNARDIGGYSTVTGQQVRWRRILRAGHLHRLTARDITTLSEIGVRTVCDLRSDTELEWTGTGPLHEHGVVTHVHHSFLGRDAQEYDARFPAERSARRAMWLERGYEPMLEHAAAPIASMFGLLAEEQRYPVIIHCVAGKDRTGVMAALVLRVLGVPDEQIVADYALTADHRPDPDTMRQMMADYGRNLDDFAGDIWQAPAQVMGATLRALDERFGSTEGYLERIGVPRQDIEALRRIMLE